MRPKKPRVASLEEVTITREPGGAIIEFRDHSIATTHLGIGRAVVDMSNEEILQCFNDTVRAREALAKSYKHVAVEVPPGSVQVEYVPESDQWVPRGHVVRCVIDDSDADDGPVVDIDGKELSLREFGTLLRTFTGWGMRIVFVPDDELEKIPEIVVREPELRAQ